MSRRTTGSSSRRSRRRSSRCTTSAWDTAPRTSSFYYRRGGSTRSSLPWRPVGPEVGCWWDSPATITARRKRRRICTSSHRSASTTGSLSGSSRGCAPRIGLRRRRLPMSPLPRVPWEGRSSCSSPREGRSQRMAVEQLG